MRFLRRRTIRARITIWSVLIATVLVSAAAFVFRTQVDAIVAQSTRTLLYSDAASYEALIHRGNTKNLPEPSDEQSIAVLDPTSVIRVSNLPKALSARIGDLLQLGDGSHRITVSPTQQYIVVNELVDGKNGTRWHILSARSSATADIVLDGLTVVMFIGSALLIAGFGISSWIVTGLALRPVTRMRQQAAQLSEASTSDTLPVGRVRDELSALAETLNEFITTVRSSADRERQMVADASHELRTPIAVLTTQLQLAHLSTGDAVALEQEIADAEATLERLANLTTNLLTLSRIEAADDDVETAGDDLLSEFLAAMDRAIILGSAHGITVDFSTDGITATDHIPISRVDLSGLVDNLVSNAIAASESGTIVAVSFRRAGLDAELSVVDSGRGIPEDFIGVAFDRFSRTEGSRTTGLGGNGLGLAIVKAIVTRSGGSVRLEPRESGGTRALVRLPFTRS